MSSIHSQPIRSGATLKDQLNGLYLILTCEVAVSVNGLCLAVIDATKYEARQQEVIRNEQLTAHRFPPGFSGAAGDHPNALGAISGSALNAS